MSKLLKVAAGLVALVSLAAPAFADGARKEESSTTATQLKVYYDTGKTETVNGTSTAVTNVNGNAVNLTIVALKEDGSVASDADIGGMVVRAAVTSVLGTVDAAKSTVVDTTTTKGPGSSIADATTSAAGIYALKVGAQQNIANNVTTSGAGNNSYSTDGTTGDGMTSLGTKTLLSALANTPGNGIVKMPGGIGAVAVFYANETGTDTISVTLQKVYQTSQGGLVVNPIGEAVTFSVKVDDAIWAPTGISMSTADWQKLSTTDKATSNFTVSAGLGYSKFKVAIVGSYMGAATVTLVNPKTNTAYATDKDYSVNFIKTATDTYTAEVTISEGDLNAIGDWVVKAKMTVNGVEKTFTSVQKIKVQACPHTTSTPWSVTSAYDRKYIATYNHTTNTPASPYLIIKVLDWKGNEIPAQTGANWANIEGMNSATYFASTDANASLSLLLTPTISTVAGTVENVTIDGTVLPYAYRLAHNLSTPATAYSVALKMDTAASTAEQAVTVANSGAVANQSEMVLKSKATVATIIADGDGGTAATRIDHGTKQVTGGAATGATAQGYAEAVGYAHGDVFKNVTVPRKNNAMKVGVDYSATTDFGLVTNWAAFQAARGTTANAVDVKIACEAAPNLNEDDAFVVATVDTAGNMKTTVIFLDADGAVTSANLLTLGYDYAQTLTVANAAADTAIEAALAGIGATALKAAVDSYTGANGGAVTGNPNVSTLFTIAATATAADNALAEVTITPATGIASLWVFELADGGNDNFTAANGFAKGSILAASTVNAALGIDVPLKDGSSVFVDVYSKKHALKYSLPTMTTTGYADETYVTTTVPNSGILKNIVWPQELVAGDYAIMYGKLADGTIYGQTKVVLMDTAGARAANAEGSGDYYESGPTAGLDLYAFNYATTVTSKNTYPTSNTTNAGKYLSTVNATGTYQAGGTTLMVNQFAYATKDGKPYLDNVTNTITFGGVAIANNSYVILRSNNARIAVIITSDASRTNAEVKALAYGTSTLGAAANGANTNIDYYVVLAGATLDQAGETTAIRSLASQSLLKIEDGSASGLTFANFWTKTAEPANGATFTTVGETSSTGSVAVGVAQATTPYKSDANITLAETNGTKWDDTAAFGTQAPEVTITSTLADAIFYTTDGTTPSWDANGAATGTTTKYSAKITLDTFQKATSLQVAFVYGTSRLSGADTIAITTAKLFQTSTQTQTYSYTVEDKRSTIKEIVVEGQKSCPVSGELLLRVYGKDGNGKVVASDGASGADKIKIKTMTSGTVLYDSRRNVGAFIEETATNDPACFTTTGRYYTTNEVGINKNTTGAADDGIRLLTFRAPSTVPADGKVTITFENGDATYYNAIDITIEATTTAGATLADNSGTASGLAVTITSADNATTVNKGETLALSGATSNFTGTESYTWTSGNTAVATIGASTGIVTGVAEGEVTITAMGGSSGATGSFKITVLDPNAPKVTVTPATASIALNAYVTLVASTTTAGATTTETYTWTSSDDNVALVGATTGKVYGAAAGTATITATGNTTGKTATAAITVTDENAPLVSVTAAGSATSVAIAETLALTATTTNATDASYTWTSSDDTIATVSDAGVVTGVAVGSVTITATGATSAAAGTIALTVTEVPAVYTSTLYCPFVYGTGTTVYVSVVNSGAESVSVSIETTEGTSTTTPTTVAAGRSALINLGSAVNLSETGGFKLTATSAATVSIIAEAQTLFGAGVLTSPVVAPMSTAGATSFWYAQGGFNSLVAIMNPGTAEATYDVTIGGVAQVVTVAAGKNKIVNSTATEGNVMIAPQADATYVASCVTYNVAGGIFLPFNVRAGTSTINGGVYKAGDLALIGAATANAEIAGITIGTTGATVLAIGTTSNAGITATTTSGTVVADILHFDDAGSFIVLPLVDSVTTKGATFAGASYVVLYNAGSEAATATINVIGSAATGTITVDSIPAKESKIVAISGSITEGAWSITTSGTIYATGYSKVNGGVLHTIGQ